MFAARKHRRAIRRAYRPLWREGLLRDFRRMRELGCKNPLWHLDELRGYTAYLRDHGLFS